MISAEAVEQVCSQVGEYSDEVMAREFERFFRGQPAICDFVVDMTHQSGQRVQEVALFLSFIVFKALESAGTESVTTVTRDGLERASRDSEAWIDHLSHAEGSALESAIVASFEKDAEPYLTQYVISELNLPAEDGIELDDNEKGEVFFLLKTVITSLSGNAERGDTGRE